MKSFFRRYLDNNASEEDLQSFVRLFADTKKQVVLEENMKEDWEKLQREVEVPDLTGSLHKIHFEINKQEGQQAQTVKNFILPDTCRSHPVGPAGACFLASVAAKPPSVRSNANHFDAHGIKNIIHLARWVDGLAKFRLVHPFSFSI